MKLIDLMESPKGTTLYERLVSNPEFQEWFRGSKIVDEAGDPVVVYHGTEIEYDPSKIKPFSHFGSFKSANKYEGRGTLSYIIFDTHQARPVFSFLETDDAQV